MVDSTEIPGLLLVDDDPLVLDSIAYMLRPDFHTYTAENRAEATKLLRQLDSPPPLALVDLGLPPYPHSAEEGFALVAELIAVCPQTRVLALSGQDEPANLRHAFALGVADFVAKPCDPETLKSRLRHQLSLLEEERRIHAESAGGLLGDSMPMTMLREQVDQFADAPFPVLIEGESGTGKELVARRLHDASGRRDKAFVAVNCAAFTESLLEAQLFGHTKGAFTGAQQARAGFFEEADGGTLFLDEIGEMPMELQTRLLRVIEAGEYYRIGETRPRKANVRLIAATNKDLLRAVDAGGFRQDLYYRLGILSIQVPPLRDRGTDRILLLDHFRDFYTGTVPPFSLSEAAHTAWMEYPFPGNVRELRNLVIRLGTRYPGKTVEVDALRRELDPQAGNDAQVAEPVVVAGDPDTALAAARERLQQGEFDLDHHLESVERMFIQAAQELAAGNQSRAAKLLNINRTTLYSRIDRLGDI